MAVASACSKMDKKMALALSPRTEKKSMMNVYSVDALSMSMRSLDLNRASNGNFCSSKKAHRMLAFFINEMCYLAVGLCRRRDNDANVWVGGDLVERGGTVPEAEDAGPVLHRDTAAKEALAGTLAGAEEVKLFCHDHLQLGRRARVALKRAQVVVVHDLHVVVVDLGRGLRVVLKQERVIGAVFDELLTMTIFYNCYFFFFFSPFF